MAAAAQISLIGLLLAGFVYLAFALRRLVKELRRLRRRDARRRRQVRELQASVSFAHDCIEALGKLMRRHHASRN